MIQRYEPEAREGLKLGVWDAYMLPNPEGEYVEYEDHRAAVRELVEALQDLLDDQTDARLSVIAQARAAIAKHQEGKA